MGGSLFKKVTPHEICGQNSSSILDPLNRSDISRANFRFLQKIVITGYNQQQVIWTAQNIRYPKQKFLIKQIDKLIIYDNNRTLTAVKQLQLWLQSYRQNNVASLFFSQILFAFQDYQYLYMVYQRIEGFTFDTVLKHHSFTEQQTKYVVAVLVQIMEFFHEKKYSLAQLSPQHFIVEKSTGKIKLLQIFNPMQIDVPYSYNVITDPSLYSAPEVLAKNKVLAESDYYTLGTVMYQMMTQKNAVLEELVHLQRIQRHHIMQQEIQLKKYNLPEGWNPEAADFLVKLLIKNPLYRLGRYGSFELRFHPWLQNYNWQILHTRAGIVLNEPFFKNAQLKAFPLPPSLNISPQDRMQMIKDPLFIKMFENYHYRMKYNYSQQKNFQMQQFQKRTIDRFKIKKSQKYYDNSQESQQEEKQEQCDPLQFEQTESKSKGQLSSNKGQKSAILKKGGRGLLNIVGKVEQ